MLAYVIEQEVIKYYLNHALIALNHYSHTCKSDISSMELPILTSTVIRAGGKF